MQLQDGFIVGIFNYCDRWCETCAFTSRCRVFADVAEMHAESDHNLKPVVDAPPLPQDVPPLPPEWFAELVGEANEAALSSRDDGEVEKTPPAPPAEHVAIEARALGYCERAHRWLRAREYSDVADPGDPRAVVTWFHTMIPAKVCRAIRALAETAWDGPDWPRDHDGSAKVALLGIDRSHAALLDIVDRGQASGAEVAALVADLVWLGEALEQVFPKARAFVRPAFDEPEEVMKLAAGGMD